MHVALSNLNGKYMNDKSEGIWCKLEDGVVFAGVIYALYLESPRFSL